MENITIFHYGDFKGKREGFSTDDLIEKAVDAWTGGKHIKVMRTAEGKPFTEEPGIFFSVSHTGTDWYCALSDAPIGFDAEKIRKVDFLKLAERFFSPGEQQLCRENGRDDFFRIWCRKEALVKFFGTTLGRGLSRFDTAPFGKTVPAVSIDGKTVYIAEPDTGKGSAAAAASAYEDAVFSFEEMDEWI